jgi:sulfonate transport system ATP-binding protein
VSGGPVSGGPAVTVRGLGRAFGAERVLDGVELSIGRGDVVALLGRSGSGKSTLLRILAGLDPGATGEVSVSGRVAVAFQEPRLLPWRRTWRNVVLGLPGANRPAALRALADVGLAGYADAWPGTLSGGQAQRVALARALAREPDVLLLDEPFGALDALTRLAAQALVQQLWATARPAVLMVTHDVDEAVLLADRALVLDGGRISYQTAVDIPRPRDRDHPRFAELRRELLDRLGVTGAATARPT